MTKNHKSLLKITTIAVISTGLLLLAGINFGIRFNHSPSVSGLLYYSTQYKPEIGSYVFICPTKNFVTQFDILKHSKKSGGCGGIKPLLKRLVALSGDHIIISPKQINVNGEDIPQSAQLLSDGNGEPLPKLSFTGEIPKGFAFVLGDHPASFDGRYFGLIKEQWITGRANIIF